MAKVKNPETFGKQTPRVKGHFYTRVTRNGLVAQAWPSGQPDTYKPWRFYTQTEFKIASKWSKVAEPRSQETARILAKGSNYVWRDILVMAMYGNLYELAGPRGGEFYRARSVTPNAQLVLDLVTDQVGAMLYRSSVGWVEVPPGNAGQVLAYLVAGPQWQDVYPVAIQNAGFIIDATDVSIPNARVIQDSTSVKKNVATAHQIALERAALTGDVTAAQNSNALTIAARAVTAAKMGAIAATNILGRKSAGSGDIEVLAATDVLDFISNTRGTVLFRGAAGWTALAPGTAGTLLQSNGAGADPNWTLATAANAPAYVCEYHKTVNQAIAASTWTAVVWDAIDVDTPGILATPAKTTFTIPAGITRVRWSMRVGWFNATTGARYWELLDVGGAREYPVDIRTAQNEAFASPTTPILPVTAGTTWQVRCNQNTAGSLNLSGTNVTFGYPCQLSVELFA